MQGQQRRVWLCFSWAWLQNRARWKFCSLLLWMQFTGKMAKVWRFSGTRKNVGKWRKKQRSQDLEILWKIQYVVTYKENNFRGILAQILYRHILKELPTCVGWNNYVVQENFWLRSQFFVTTEIKGIPQKLKLPMDLFETFPECSLPSTVSKNTIKMIGRHARLKRPSHVKLVSNNKHGNLQHGRFLSVVALTYNSETEEKKRRNRKRWRNRKVWKKPSLSARSSVLFVFIRVFVG